LTEGSRSSSGCQSLFELSGQLIRQEGLLNLRPIDPFQEIFEDFDREELEQDRVLFAALLGAHRVVRDVQDAGNDWGKPLKVASVDLVNDGFDLDNKFLFALLTSNESKAYLKVDGAIVNPEVRAFGGQCSSGWT
jgi:hypothetical protein